jgi:hypothetical protein
VAFELVGVGQLQPPILDPFGRPELVRLTRAVLHQHAHVREALGSDPGDQLALLQAAHDLRDRDLGRGRCGGLVEAESVYVAERRAAGAADRAWSPGRRPPRRSRSRMICIDGTVADPRGMPGPTSASGESAVAISGRQP